MTFAIGSSLSRSNIGSNIGSSYTAVDPRFCLSETLDPGFAPARGKAALWIQRQLSPSPIIDEVGYVNPCVGWDSAPAIYVALPLFVAIAGLTLRYVVVDAVADVRHVILQMLPPNASHGRSHDTSSCRC
mgnify:CR=1 FL=1